MPIIYGFLERITYHNEENDFVVAKLQEKGVDHHCWESDCHQSRRVVKADREMGS